MKKTFKNTLFSLLVAIALVLSANFSLAFAMVNSFKNTASSEYKPTDFRAAYEFSSTTNNGWNTNTQTISNSSVKETFKESSTSKVLSSITDEAYRPTETFDGKPTANIQNGSGKDYGAMMLKANNAPTTAEIEKIVDNKVVFQTNPETGDFVYVEETPGVPKEYASNSGDTERFVLKPGTTDVYFEKKAEMETVNVYCYYETSSSSKLDLAANSYYVISAYVSTINTDASIMVTGSKFETEVKIGNTNKAWKKVYIFVETSSDNKNAVQLRFYYGSSEGVSQDTSAGAKVSGAAFLDQVSIQTINKTDYQQRTIGGIEPTEGADVHNYSPRYDYTSIMEHINHNFENVTDNGDDTYNFNLYEELYGTNTYDKNNDLIKNQGYYQYYINKYTADDGKTKLTEKQLALFHKAYNEKFTTSVVLESKAFEKEEVVKDASGSAVLDGNQNEKTEIVPGESTFNLNNHALKLENKSEKYSLGLLSAPIEINQFGYYKLTVFAKGLSKEDSATVKLISYIKTGSSSEEGKMQVKSQTVNPYSTDKYSSNNWTEITFYIKGSSYYNTTMQVALLADKESTVYYDELRLEGITSATYSSSAASGKQFDLFPSATAINSSITNGNFDNITTDDVNPNEISKPYVPQNWDKLSGYSKDVVSGIISSTHEFYEFAKDKDGTLVKSLIGNAENPIKPFEHNGAIINPAKTNLLVLYAPKQVDGQDKTHSFTYKTATSTLLSASSAYKITFEVYFDNTNEDSNFNGNVFANLIYSDKSIAEFSTDVEESISSDAKGKWVTYTFLVHTGSASKSVYLELGIKDAVGTIFFQKVRYTKLAEKTVDDEKISVDTQFEELVKENNSLELEKQNNVKVVAFENNPFSMHSNQKVEDKDYYSSLSHSLKTETNKDKETVVVKDQGEIGIVDLTEADGLKLSPSLSLDSAFMQNTKTNANYAMLIHNSSNYFTTVLPVSDITLSSSSYYEITLYVKTKDIADGNGLKIYMDKISATFSNVNTESDQYGDLTDSNGYKKFTVLVKTGSSTISGLKISYELGEKNNMFTGTALVSDLKVTKLKDEAAYNELLETVNSEDKSTTIKDFSTHDDHDHSHEHADNLTLATFFLVFSSILLVAVLVFALVAVYIKKLPQVKTTNTTTTVSGKKNTKDSDVQKDGFI